MDNLKFHPSDNTLKSYLDHLEDAFLFAKARRFDVKGKKYIDSPFKFYAADLGLRNARLNFRDTDPSQPMENAIFNELLLRGCNVDVGVVPIATLKDGVKETRQHEIDFIVNRGNDRLYIQSALELSNPQKRDQEKLPLKKSGDFFGKVIILCPLAPILKGEFLNLREVPYVARRHGTVVFQGNDSYQKVKGVDRRCLGLQSFFQFPKQTGRRIRKGQPWK